MNVRRHQKQNTVCRLVYSVGVCSTVHGKREVSIEEK